MFNFVLVDNRLVQTNHSSLKRKATTDDVGEDIIQDAQKTKKAKASDNVSRIPIS